MAESADRILPLTAQIAVAYMGANAVDARAVPELLRDIHRALTGLDPDRAKGEPEQILSVKSRLTAKAGVDSRKSVFPDHLVCLEDGKAGMDDKLACHIIERTQHGHFPGLSRRWNA